MKRLGYVISTVSALFMLSLSLTMQEPPYSLPGLAIALWATSPHLFLIVLVWITNTSASLIAALVVIFVENLAAAVLLWNNIVVNPDPQGGLIFLFLPLWQWIGLLLVMIPVLALSADRSGIDRSSQSSG